MKILLYIIFALLLFFTGTFFVRDSQTSLGNSESASISEYLEDEYLILFNNYLVRSEILNWLGVRKRLLSLSIADLKRVLDNVKSRRNVEVFRKALEEIVQEKKHEDLYLIKYDCLINNVPPSLDSPYYGSPSQSLNISDLKSYADNLYWGNLRLECKGPRGLTDQGGGLWQSFVHRKEKTAPVSGYALPLLQGNIFPFDEFSKTCSKLWSHALNGDNRIPLLVFRSGSKEYEDVPLYPIIYQNTVIVKNEYRVFCFDLAGGKELWSFGNVDNSFREYYLTAFPLQCNSSGYRILRGGNVLYADLGGDLVALDVQNIVKPSLLWKRPLGEYILCTSPALFKDKIIAGLINSKGELWVCGFDRWTGGVSWNTYIGITDYQSPSSSLFAVFEDKVFVGTNCGVLACVYPDNGELVWIKKYIPKKTSIFGIWKIWADSKFKRDSRMSYDTQFLEVGEDRILYYKPRESDYLYVLDPADGHTREELLIDPEKFFLLGVCKGNAVFLEKNNDFKSNVWIRVIALGSSKQIYAFPVENGLLKGAMNKSDGLVFKVGGAVYFLRIDTVGIEYKKVDNVQGEWLLSSNASVLFTGDRSNLFCWSVLNRKTDSFGDDFTAAYILTLEKVKRRLAAAVESGSDRESTEEEKKKLLREISSLNISLKEIFPLIADHIETFRHPGWKDFLAGLAGLYGEEVVCYRDINITFSSFLIGKSLIQAIQVKGGNLQGRDVQQIGKAKKYSIKGSSVIPYLPVQVAKGPKLPDFYLLVKNEQLFCVQENGLIRWARSICIGCNKEGIPLDFPFEGPCEIFLYDNILIINDFSSIIAVRAEDGSFIWSMEHLARGRTFMHFIEDQIVIVNGNKMYAVKPATGMCSRYRMLDMNSAESVVFYGKSAYILSSSLDTIKVMNKGLAFSREVKLPSTVERKRGSRAKLLLMRDYFVIDRKPDVFVVDMQRGALTSALNMGEKKEYYVEAQENTLLIIFPCEKIEIYRREHGIFKAAGFSLGDADPPALHRVVSNKEQTGCYFLDDEYVLFLFRRKGRYFIDCIDFKNARITWEAGLDTVSGYITHMEFFKEFQGKIHLLISTIGGEAGEREVCTNESIGVFKAQLLSFDSHKRAWRKMRTFPPHYENTVCFLRGMETKNYFLYSLFGNRLEAVPKNESVK